MRVVGFYLFITNILQFRICPGNFDAACRRLLNNHQNWIRQTIQQCSVYQGSMVHFYFFLFPSKFFACLVFFSLMCVIMLLQLSEGANFSQQFTTVFLQDQKLLFRSNLQYMLWASYRPRKLLKIIFWTLISIAFRISWTWGP